MHHCVKERNLSYILLIAHFLMPPISKHATTCSRRERVHKNQSNISLKDCGQRAARLRPSNIINCNPLVDLLKKIQAVSVAISIPGRAGTSSRALNNKQQDEQDPHAANKYPEVWICTGAERWDGRWRSFAFRMVGDWLGGWRGTPTY